MMPGAYEARVWGDGDVTVRYPRGTVAGWRWDGSALVHFAPQLGPEYRAGLPSPLRFGTSVTAAVAEAVAETSAGYRPGRTERLTGLGLSRLPEADREGFEWDGDVDDDVGHYVRHTPAVLPCLVVPFTADDVEMIRKKPRE